MSRLTTAGSAPGSSTRISRHSAAAAAPSAAPSANLWLGYLGLVPFVGSAVWLTAMAFHLVGPEMLGHVALAILIYGALILSFLGGVRWGTAMALGEEAAGTYLLSVVPVIFGWLAALLTVPFAALLLQAAALLLQGAIDASAAERGVLPAWYGELRRRLGFVASAALIVAAGSLLLALRDLG